MIFLLLLLILFSTYILISADLLVNSTLIIGWVNLGIFVLSLVLFQIKYRKKTLFNPELLFSIIFIFCTFFYLPLMYNSKIDSFIFGELVKESNINLIRSQSIAVLSFLFYLLGAVIIHREKIKKTDKITILETNILIKKRKVFHIITFLLILLSMLTGGYKIIYRYSESSIGLDEIGALFSYITIFIVISSVLEYLYLRKENINTLKNTVKFISRLYLFNLLFMSTLFLASGYRSAVFPLLIPVVFLYDLYINKINKVVLVFLLFSAFILMLVINDTRGGNTVSENLLSLENIGEDFISANKGLYYLIDYTDRHGNQQGQNAILQMVSFIPYGQSFVINIFGFTPSESSSQFFTNGLESYWSGLGTHVVGDLYYSFGLFGTLFWMFLLGIFTSYLYNRITMGGVPNVLVITVYLLILGNSVMFPRVEFFSLVQKIGFSLIIILFFLRLFRLKTIY